MKTSIIQGIQSPNRVVEGIEEGQVKLGYLRLKKQLTLACATGSTTGNLSCQLSTMLQECWQLALQQSQDFACATASTPGNVSCQISTMLQECCLVALQHSQDSVWSTGSTPGNLSCQLSTMLQECCLLALQQMIFIANRVLPSLDKCRLIMAFFGPIWPSLVQFGLLCTNLGKFWPYFNPKRNRIDLFDLFLCKF